jgi:small subunit ribosomal protein S8
MGFSILNKLLIKIRNAQKSKKRVVICSKTAMTQRLVSILKVEGFILGFSHFEFGSKKFLKIFLKYLNFLPTISKIKVISKPSKRIFFNSKSISKFSNNTTGLLLLHTNQGLLTHKQCKLLNIGGEVVVFLN